MGMRRRPRPIRWNRSGADALGASSGVNGFSVRPDLVGPSPWLSCSPRSQTEGFCRPVPTEYSVRVVTLRLRREIAFSDRMTVLFVALLASLRATIRSRLELAAEILALRHQLAVLQRATPKRPRLRPLDRLLWMLLSSVWPNWRQAVQIVTPATVVRWHRRAFAAYWRWNPRPRRIGRPALVSSLRGLICQMRDANPL
jgi:hypothetical protein